VAVSGILLGGVYALVAGGLTLIFGVMRVINLAHGELLMLGAYTTFWLFVRSGLDPLLSLLVSVPLLFLIGAAVQRYLVGRVVRRPLLISLLLTFGLSLFLTGLAQQLWTNDYRSVPYLSGSLPLAGLAVSRTRLVAFAVALVLTGAAYAFLRWGRWGRALRATSQNADAALACGVDVDRARLIAFALGAALAGAAGTLAAFMYSVFPEMGHTFMLKAFAVIVLGGMGSFAGAFLAALLLGLVEAFAAFWTTTQIAEALIYLLLVLALLLRPNGLFGLREA
jgi:branched-chain amino acid transport system permease protein